jgi:hypothetical protein
MLASGCRGGGIEAWRRRCQHRGVEEEQACDGRRRGAGVEPRRGTYQEAADIKVQRRSGHAVTP